MTKERQIDEVFEDVLERFVSRRNFLKSSSMFAASTMLLGCNKATESEPAPEILTDSITQPEATTATSGPSSLTFTELAHGLDENLAVAEGYDAQVLLRWGDPLFEGVEDFDPSRQSEAEQLQRFGFNNDFIGFVSLPLNSDNSDHGLLVINHEYTLPSLMFPGSPQGNKLTAEQVAIDIAAHGLSVVEVKRMENGQWAPVLGSKFNRRITPKTPMQISGAAQGSERLKTIISQDGVKTLGTYGNCAGGVTPWGTILTGEENVDGYFSGDPQTTGEAENYERFGMKYTYKNWGEFHDRWHFQKNPNELLHVGWIVEIDPFDPDSTPKKRTSLGRCKHEGCNVYINDDGRIVAYTGDDQRFEYIYKFVSTNKYDPENRQANMDLLDDGILYVAKFLDDGTLEWLPLIFGQGELLERNGFFSQADVVIDVRKAGDLVGATPMDRPEDVEVNPVNGKVYAMLTNNTKRKPEDVDPANPRAHNSHGHIVEFWPENGDHGQSVFRWDLALLAGKPGEVSTQYHPDVSDNGWLSCPDNCAFDTLGNLWIATDGAEKSGVADGVWAMELSGEHRALTKRFLRTPIGAELCGPFFTPNAENFFVSVQHPADGSTYDEPSTRWPDFSENLPPRPSVVVITKEGGGRVGS